ncbi:MAG: hypothetical protein QF393_12080 [Rhodospirillales bacterium]|jgi:hypothetical protein|nr:hypothetical protein [Rhodospirillales bacterium]
MFRLVVILLLVLGFAFAVVPARAQGTCAAYDDLAALLGKKYGEHPVNWGLSSDGNLVEVFASDSGSWTVVVTNPRGISCIRAAGESWTVAPTMQADERDDEYS